MIKVLLSVSVVLLATLVFAEPPPAGTVIGTCSYKGEAAVKLAYASVFVDQQDSEKPKVLILSDIKLPTETWTSQFDIMRFKKPFSGVIFYITSDNPNTRVEIYWKGQQSAVSGYFTLTLDAPGASGKELLGTVVTDTKRPEEPHVDATFRAVLK